MMMKIFRFVSMFALLIVTSMVSLSAGAVTQTGVIQTVFVQQNGTVLVTLDSPAMLTGCATTDRFAFRFVDSQTGKAFYALTLTAAALNRFVTIAGKDTCNTHPDAEDVRFIQLLD